MSKEKKKPVASFGPYRTDRNTSVEVACWKNESEHEGRKIVTFNVTLKRSYKDGDDWQQGGALRVQDIPAVIHGLQKAFGFILDSRNGNDATSE